MLIRVASLVVAVVFAVGCGGGDGSGGSSSSTTSPSVQQGLEGSWKATKAEFVSTANSSRRVDVISKGSTLTLALTGSNFTYTIADPGQAPKVTTGTWSASRDLMTMTPSGMSWSWQFDMTQSGNTLTLEGASVEFDFTIGTYEQAKLYMTLTRQ